MGLKFSDGMEFDTSGPLRVITKSDGDYVIGQGMLIPVNSKEEGQTIIDRMKGKTSTENQGNRAYETFESFNSATSTRMIKEENSLKDLVGKGEEEELDLDDARVIGKKMSKMHGDDRKKFVGIVNFMGASCKIYNEIWANYKPVDPKRMKANKGKEYRGDKEVGKHPQ